MPSWCWCHPCLAPVSPLRHWCHPGILWASPMALASVSPPLALVSPPRHRCKSTAPFSPCLPREAALGRCPGEIHGADPRKRGRSCTPKTSPGAEFPLFPPLEAQSWELRLLLLMKPICHRDNPSCPPWGPDRVPDGSGSCQERDLFPIKVMEFPGAQRGNKCELRVFLRLRAEMFEMWECGFLSKSNPRSRCP